MSASHLSGLRAAFLDDLFEDFFEPFVEVFFRASFLDFLEGPFLTAPKRALAAVTFPWPCLATTVELSHLI
jgi:hypothetical protein